MSAHTVLNNLMFICDSTTLHRVKYLKLFDKNIYSESSPKITDVGEDRVEIGFTYEDYDFGHVTSDYLYINTSVLESENAMVVNNFIQETNKEYQEKYDAYIESVRLKKEEQTKTQEKNKYEEYLKLKAHFGE